MSTALTILVDAGWIAAWYALFTGIAIAFRGWRQRR